MNAREVEIVWPSVSTLIWEQGYIVDMTTKRQASLEGVVSQSAWIMTYRFDRATGFRHRDGFWSAVYENHGTKAVLMKNGSVHRELNRSYYCAGAYDYPITIAANQSGRAVVVHCPHEFNLLRSKTPSLVRLLSK